MEYLAAAIVGMVGVIVGALITGAYQRRRNQAAADKDAADTNEVIRQTVMSLLTPLRTQVNEQDQRIKSQDDEISNLKAQLSDWKNWAFALVEQLKSLGCHEPVPFKSSKK